MNSPTCRLCGDQLVDTFVDLGMSPPCEDFLTNDRLDSGEAFYPLNTRVCRRCLLVQLPAYLAADELFTDDYAYYSSFSTSWLRHAERYAHQMTERLGLGSDSLVTEAASNDGYLLQYFATAGIPVLGIEPTAGVADAAEEKGIPTERVFLGRETGHELAERHGQADLVVGNNVYAHVPDVVDFTAGLAALLKPTGTLTLEFPHLMRLIEFRQFDTIYHEHFSYYTLLTAQRALATAGLLVTDVEELPSHGGSLRVYAQHAAAAEAPSPAVDDLMGREAAAGLHDLAGYAGFAPQVEQVKDDFLSFLLQAKRDGKKVLGYGAPGKGNTFLNYAGIKSDLLPFTVDRNHHKHGLYCPGSHIPIRPVSDLLAERPDFVFILPWNLRREIAEQLAEIGEWGGQFVVAIPELEVWSPR